MKEKKKEKKKTEQLFLQLSEQVVVVPLRRILPAYRLSQKSKFKSNFRKSFIHNICLKLITIPPGALPPANVFAKLKAIRCLQIYIFVFKFTSNVFTFHHFYLLQIAIYLCSFLLNVFEKENMTWIYSSASQSATISAKREIPKSVSTILLRTLWRNM